MSKNLNGDSNKVVSSLSHHYEDGLQRRKVSVGYNETPYGLHQAKEYYKKNNF